MSTETAVIHPNGTTVEQVNAELARTGDRPLVWTERSALWDRLIAGADPAELARAVRQDRWDWRWGSTPRYRGSR